MHPLKGMLALLEVCSTSAGIPPRKIRCKFNGWSLGSTPCILASSSTWTAKDLLENKNSKMRKWIITHNKTSSTGVCYFITKTNANLPASLSMRSVCSLPSFSVPCSGRLVACRRLWLPVDTTTSSEPLVSMTER